MALIACESGMTGKQRKAGFVMKQSHQIEITPDKGRMASCAIDAKLSLMNIGVT
jgi:hypothetical protein